MADNRSILVVVDTNRPDFVESEQLLDTCNRVAVIDHHRRAASYIESAALNFHELRLVGVGAGERAAAISH